MAGKKILVVDADVASRNFIARTLEQQQYEVIQAGSGKEGLIFAWRDRPDLIVTEPALSDLKGEEMAVKLRQDARSERIPLIALSADRTATRHKSCLDAGFNEYIIKSADAIPTLIEAVNRLLGVTAVRTKQGGVLIVFLSAKGGIGTSSLCANIAMNIAQAQPESHVAVVDMVLPIGSIAPIVGYSDEQNLVTVADLGSEQTGRAFFQSNLAEVEQWHFHLLAGSPDPESANHLQVGRIRDIIQNIRSAYDYLLLDVGRSLSRFSLPLIQEADLQALVVSPDVSAVSLNKTMLDYLRLKGISNASVYAILNRAVGLEGLTKAEAEKVLEIDIKNTVPYLGSTLTLANNQHQPFSVKYPNDTTSGILKEMADHMINMARHLRVKQEAA
ncbi:MAG TPA: response regulator [Anaerolineales bacterium]|nr:response regulator [Anaerolineales bacterium]